MLFLNWIRTGSFVVLCVARGDAGGAYGISNSSIQTSTSILTSTHTSTSKGAVTTPASITACPTTINPFDLLPPGIQTLPPAEQTLALASEFGKIQEFLRNFESIQASPTGINPASLSSYLLSLYSTLEADVTSLLGPDGNAFLAFQSITDPCLHSTCMNQFLSQRSTFALANPTSVPFFYTASPPCCDQCTVNAQGVQLDFWPTPAPSPAVSTLIDEKNNRTFVSPSVYAVFTSLRAWNLCGAVGRNIPLVTLAFNPTELSSSSILVNPSFLPVLPALGNWTAINYADFGPKCSCTANCPFDPLRGTTVGFTCTPQLSLPGKVSDFDLAWATCVSDLLGTFDPPIALPKAPGLTAPKTTLVDSTPDVGPTSPPTVIPPVPVQSPTLPVSNPTPQPESSNPPPPLLPVNSPSAPPPPPPPPPPTQLTSQVDLPFPVNSPPPPPSPPATQQTSQVNLFPPVPESPALSAPTPPSTPPAVLPPIVVGSITLTMVGGSSIFVVDSQTISAGGPPVTANGQTVSIPASGDEIVIGGTQTLALGAPQITISENSISVRPSTTDTVIEESPTQIGSIILSFLGSTPTSTILRTEGGTGTVSAPTEFTGKAMRGCETGMLRPACFAAALLAIVVLL